MPFQPQSKPKNQENPSYCSVFEQQRQSQGRQEDWKYYANFCFLSQSTNNNLDTWDNYNGALDELLDLIEESSKKSANELSKVELQIKLWLEKLNNTPIRDILKSIQDEFAEKIKIVVDFVKEKTAPFFKKIAKFFTVTLNKIKAAIVGAVMRAIANGHDRVADVIIKSVDRITSFITKFRMQISKVERILITTVRNPTLINKLKKGIDAVRKAMSSLGSALATGGSAIAKNGFLKVFLGRIAACFDVFIEAYYIIVRWIDDKTNYSDTGNDSFWFHVAKFIIAAFLAVIALVLAKFGLAIMVAASVVFVGIALLDLDDSLALYLADPLKRSWDATVEFVNNIGIAFERKYNELKREVKKGYEDVATDWADQALWLKDQLRNQGWLPTSLE